MDLPWVPLEGGWQQSRPPGTCGPLSISLLQVRPERIPTKRSHSLRGDSWPFVRQAGAGVGLGRPGRAGHVGFPGGLWCQQQGSKGAPGRAPHGIGAPTGLRLSRSPAAPDQLHLPSPPKRKHDLLWRPPPPPATCDQGRLGGPGPMTLPGVQPGGEGPSRFLRLRDRQRGAPPTRPGRSRQPGALPEPRVPTVPPGGVRRGAWRFAAARGAPAALLSACPSGPGPV